ncbi:stage III sporulation protein AA, partial [Bacillus sp. SIMBA_069]
VLEAVNAGIKLMITTHGHTLDEIKKRPFIAEILKQNIFERFIELQRSKSGKRSYKVLDAAGVPIFLGEGVNPHV